MGTQTRPKVIGVTGGIGSGKSVVSQIFNQIGCPYYNADLEAKQLLNQDSELKATIISLLGKGAYRNDEYNPTHVKEVVLKDDNKLSELNRLVHSAVARHFEEWLIKNAKAPFVVKESALILSHNLQGYDQLIYVHAEKEECMHRVLNRDSTRTTEEIKRIMALQKQDKSDSRINFIVYNTQKDKVLEQCLKIFNELSLL